MHGEATRSIDASRRTAGLVALAVLVMMSAWIVGTPPSAGPDEPGHHVRAGALVRGQLDGVRVDGVFQHGFELPAHIGAPRPDCFAFQPYTPATCAADLETPSGTAILETRAADYPIWGHLAAGVGTFAPASSSPWATRLADGAVPLVVLAWSLIVAARRGAIAIGATMLAATPMAWFMFSTVNPSGTAIAGGVALWTGLSALAPVTSPATSAEPNSDGDDRDADALGRAIPWLTAAGWAALVLPRRDGLVWAALILAVALIAMSLGVRTLARRLGPGPLVLIGAATLATLAWASRSDTNDARALFLTPLAPAAAVIGRRIWWKLAPRTPAFRAAVVLAAGVVGALAMLVVMSTRTNGFDRFVLRLVIGETGNNLRQAIGVLGWLDTPTPTSVMFLYVVAVGALAGAVVMAGDRQVGLGMVAVLSAAVLASWTLTMLQNNDTGTYWQGRYYLPLLAGIPILAARVRLDAAASRRLGLSVLITGLVVTNAAFAGMMRRFADGLAGTLLPWDWDTYGAPLPPVVLLVAHVAASVFIVIWAAGTGRTDIRHLDASSDGDSVLDT